MKQTSDDALWFQSTTNNGELLVSLCYNNHLERLTVGVFEGKFIKSIQTAGNRMLCNSLFVLFVVCFLFCFCLFVLFFSMLWVFTTLESTPCNVQPFYYIMKKRSTPRLDMSHLCTIMCICLQQSFICS